MMQPNAANTGEWRDARAMCATHQPSFLAYGAAQSTQTSTPPTQDTYPKGEKNRTLPLLCTLCVRNKSKAGCSQQPGARTHTQTRPMCRPRLLPAPHDTTQTAPQSCPQAKHPPAPHLQTHPRHTRTTPSRSHTAQNDGRRQPSLTWCRAPKAHGRADS